VTVFIVIAVHNRVAATLRCLQDLARQKDQPMRIIVIDGGSTDGTAQAVVQEHPGVEVIAPGENLWWTQAMALGVERAREQAKSGDFVLSLNDDVEIDDERYLSKIVALSQSHGRALAGSTCWKDRARTRRESGGGWARWNTGMLIFDDMVDDRTEPLLLDFIVGRGLLIPIEVFDRVGNFNAADFPQYCSDTDFTLRAREAGFHLVASRSVELFHAMPTRSARIGHFFLSYHDAWARLTGVNSSYSLSQNYRFLRRHCPPRFAVRAGTAFTLKAFLFTLFQTFPLGLIGVPLLWSINRTWKRGFAGTE